MATSSELVRQDWFHSSDSSVQRIFGPRAQGNATAEVFPPVGSAEWKALFPQSKAPMTDSSAQPAWLERLYEVKKAGLIPDVPLSKAGGGGHYPEGVDPKGSLVYSSKHGCEGPKDVWRAPSGLAGLAFDDGPLPDSSPILNAFLREKKQPVTRFYIGSHILDYPDLFLEAYEKNGDDIACHTYTHPHLTTLSDEVVVAELGWLLEIVRVSTKGKIPKYFRPPYGDLDNRIRAIAEHVFGLVVVMWSHSSGDWKLGDGLATQKEIEDEYVKFYGLPKDPGLIILSHELTRKSAEAFINTYHLLEENGWNPRSIPDLWQDEG